MQQPAAGWLDASFRIHLSSSSLSSDQEGKGIEREMNEEEGKGERAERDMNGGLRLKQDLLQEKGERHPNVVPAFSSCADAAFVMPPLFPFESDIFFSLRRR